MEEIFFNTLGNVILSSGFVASFVYLLYITYKHKNFSKRTFDEKYLSVVGTNFLIGTTVSLFFFNYRKFFFSDRIIPSISLIIILFIVVDALNYWMHRTWHRTPVLKQLIHLQHHDAVDVVPLDIYYLTTLDFLTITFSYILSCIVLRSTYLEMMIIGLVFFLHGMYLHAEEKGPFFIPGFLDSSHHELHHHVGGGGNYGFFFSFWDTLLKTKLQQPADPDTNKKDTKEKEKEK